MTLRLRAATLALLGLGPACPSPPPPPPAQLTVDELFQQQLGEFSTAASLVASAAQSGDLAGAQRQWRDLWERAVKVEQLIRDTDVQAFGRLFAQIGSRGAPALGVHAIEAALFGRVPDLALAATLSTQVAAEVDGLRAQAEPLSEETIVEAAFDAWRQPFENLAGTTTPLAGIDSGALRALLVGTSAYLELAPGLLSEEPALSEALSGLKAAVGADPVSDANEIPGYLSAVQSFSRALAQTAAARKLNIGADPNDDFDPLFLPRAEAFKDNFLREEPEVVELGRLLFFDPLLSEAEDRACSSCHDPEKFYQDDRPKGLGLSGTDLRRATPTIVNAALQHGSFWDFRVDDLPSQALKPISEPEEMGSNIDIIFQRLGANAEYVQRFNEAFTDGLQLLNMAAAITAFEATLLAVDSPVDRFLSGDLVALSASEKRGLTLYLGKARCGNCHFVPTFGGTQGPSFANTDVRVIGVPATDDDEELSDDIGFEGVSQDPQDRGGFKVPILRNIAESAPYMHNGAFQDLREVINFYSAGGGPGLNLPVPNADPRMILLNLSNAEKLDLEAFLRALSDDTTVIPGAPEAVPSGLPPGGRGF
jgi:cytochrome c peroxidase